MFRRVWLVAVAMTVLTACDPRGGDSDDVACSPDRCSQDCLDHGYAVGNCSANMCQCLGRTDADADADGDGDGDGDSDAGSDGDSDGDSDADPDAEADAGFDAEPDGEFDADCRELWDDPISGLLWEFAPPHDTTNRREAMDRCDGLRLCGGGGWRLPTILELRSLIRGCPATEPGGACGVVGDCWSCYTSVCNVGCPGGGGPDVPGCYWPGELGYDCSPRGMGFWSSSLYSPGASDGWIVEFGQARVFGNGTVSWNESRCVHDGP